MKIDGLKLLLLFAYGPVRKGFCADKMFSRKIKKYLAGGKDLGEKIEDEIPNTLIKAWKNLQLIAEQTNRDPLDAKTVNRYVFQIHNEDVMGDCAVKNGSLKLVNMEKRWIYVVNKSGQSEKVRFLPIFDDLVGHGNKYYYHHGWLIFIA